MALGGTIRGKTTTLRMPVEADLEAYARWSADMRVRRLHKVWHEPAMPATWKERLKDAAKEKQDLIWSIDAGGTLIGMALVHLTQIGSDFYINQLVVDPEHWRKGYGFDAALALHRFFFDYLDQRRGALDVHADNAAMLRILDRLGYQEFARGHQAHYRDGAYVDEVKLFVDKEAWQQRFSDEHEYARLGPEAFG